MVNENVSVNLLQLDRRQIEEIEQAVKEAVAGLFLSDVERDAFMEELDG